MASNGKEYKMAIKIAGEIERSFTKSMKLSKDELRNIAKTAAQTNASMSSSFGSGFDSISNGFNKFESGAKKALKNTAKLAAVTATALAAVTVPSITVGSDFESQMSTVQSISKATSTELEQLSEKAKEVGASTSFSATESGQAMEYMAMAGWKTNQMIAGIDGIMDLAAASGEDLGSVSDIVTDALTAFNLKAEDSTHFSDVLAAASSNANTNVGMMGETFTYAASVAGALGYTVEDTALAIGLMANSGIKSSQAGTALRRILAETTDGIVLQGKALGKYHIETQNTDGSMRNLKDIMDDIRVGFSGLTESEKAANAESIAGKTAMAGLLSIVNSSETDYNKLYDSIMNCNGAAEEMANVKLDNLKGDTTILKSGLEGLGIQIYEDIKEPAREVIQFITGGVSSLSKYLKNNNIIGGFISDITEKIPTARRYISDFADDFSDFAEPIFSLGEFLIKNPKVIISTLAGIGSVIVTYKIASNVKSLYTSFSALATVLTNPFAASILGVGVAIGGAVSLATYIKQCNEEMKRQNLADHFGDISLSLEDLEEVASFIIQNDSLGKLQEALSAFDDMSQIQSSIQDSLESINKMNWKVSVGMKLSDDEKESYIQEIGQYIDDVNSIVEQKQYAITLAVGVLTDDDLEGNNIIDQINSFYAGKEQELSELGSKLNSTVTDAFTDGLLDMDEVKEITEIQQQMAEIQSQLASSNFESELEVMNVKYSGAELDADSFQNLQEELTNQVESAVADYDESLSLSIANAKVMLKDGAIDVTEYNNMVAEFKENYLEQVGEIELKASNFQLDTIYQQYDSEISSAQGELQSITNEMIQNLFNNIDVSDMSLPQMWEGVTEAIKNQSYMDDSSTAAIKELLDKYEDSYNRLIDLKAKYEQAGIEIPQEISDSIERYTELKGLVAGDVKSAWSYLADIIDNNPDYVAMLQKLKEEGMYIPEEISNAIKSNKGKVSSGISSLFNEAKSSITNIFSKGFSLNVPVKVNYKTESNGNKVAVLDEKTKKNILNASALNTMNVGGHASGGIFDTYHIAEFCEGNSTEAIIPIDGSENAMNLWLMAGQLLGMFQSDKSEGFSSYESLGSSSDSFSNLYKKMDDNTNENNTSQQIVYNPTVNINGNASKEDVVEALDISQEKFERMMAQYIKDNGRVSFA